jgi:hypothetical protein
MSRARQRGLFLKRVRLTRQSLNADTSLEHVRPSAGTRSALMACAYSVRKTGVHPRIKSEGRLFSEYALVLYATSMLSAYQVRMIGSLTRFRPLPCAVAVVALLALGATLSGCADMSDGMTSAFADPAKYELYECKQLETERKSLATRAAELQGLIAKAQTGVAGPVVAEIAYRNDYIAVRGQAKNAEEAWRRNKCHETPPSAATSAATPAASSAAPTTDKPARPLMRSGNAVY